MTPRGLLVAGALAMLGLLATGAAAAPPDTVIFATVSSFDRNYAPMFVARELGYFAKENIDVQVVNFEGATALLPQLAANRVTLGFPNAEPVILSRDVGKPSLPVKYFYNVLRSNTWEFAVPETSSIRTLHDLKGKRIGIFGLSSGNLPITKAILADAGLQPSDYDLVPVGLGGPALLALESNKVDAMNLFMIFDDQAAASGLHLRLLPVPKRFDQFVSNGFAANVDTIRDHPDLLVRFARAIAKGTIACQNNFAGCMRTMWKYSPTMKPPNLSDADALKMSERAFYREVAQVSVAPPGHYGEYNPAMWTAFVSALHEGGLLSTTAISTDSLFTNALVHDINAFDYAAVVRDAKRLP